jgi:hypothetical protein
MVSLNQIDRDNLNFLIAGLSIVIALYLVFGLVIPNSFSTFAVTLGSIGIAVSSVGFSAFFAVRNSAITASRGYDARIIEIALGQGKDGRAVPEHELKSARLALRLSSSYRSLARSRSTSMMFLFYAAVAYLLATILALVPAPLFFWITLFGLGLALSTFAVLVNLFNLGGIFSELLGQSQGPSVWSSLPRRWVLTVDALSRFEGLESLAKELETSAKLPATLETV